MLASMSDSHSHGLRAGDTGDAARHALDGRITAGLVRPVAHHRLGVEVQTLRTVELAGPPRLALVELVAVGAGQQDRGRAVTRRAAHIGDAVQRAGDRRIARRIGQSRARRWAWSGHRSRNWSRSWRGCGSRGWCRYRWRRSRSRWWARHSRNARIARHGRVAAGTLRPVAGVLLRVEVQQRRAVHRAGERAGALVELGAVDVRQQDRLGRGGRAVRVRYAIALRYIRGPTVDARVAAGQVRPVAGLFARVVVQPHRAQLFAGVAAVTLVELAAVTVGQQHGMGGVAGRAVRVRVAVERGTGNRWVARLLTGG
uniref:Uncharacterized protein n=1 Tax=Anopheles dirus TaxID=7168 RepID=A0A182NVR3_9DIPT